MFVTSQGLFYYKVMSFGLKNVGVTYYEQDICVADWRNVQVYVDDVLVKS